MENLDNVLLAEEIKVRNKINQLFHILKDAQKKDGLEKETIINKAFELVSQLYLNQDKRIRKLLTQEQAEINDEIFEESFESRDIFSENPFEGELSEIPAPVQDNHSKPPTPIQDNLTKIPAPIQDNLTKISGVNSIDSINAARKAFFEAVQLEENEDDAIVVESIENIAKKLKFKQEQIDRTKSLLDYLQKTQYLKELAEMEAEMEISGNEFNCAAHKGPLEGSSYICPRCKSLYCLKCAVGLKEQEKKCLLCNLEIQL